GPDLVDLYDPGYLRPTALQLNRKACAPGRVAYGGNRREESETSTAIESKSRKAQRRMLALLFTTGGRRHIHPPDFTGGGNVRLDQISRPIGGALCHARSSSDIGASGLQSASNSSRVYFGRRTLIGASDSTAS